MDTIDYGFRPSREQFLVVLLVDRAVPHPHAQMHVVHNPVQTLPWRMESRYIPPWPQVSLKHRDLKRGDEFKNVAYIGYLDNLEPELTQVAFTTALEDLSMRLLIPEPKDWHDFTNFDVVLAVRTFGRQNSHLNRPALKLINAWAAGVPAILGHESAYVTEGEPGINYLEGVTSRDVLDHLARLKANPTLRQSLVAAGRSRLKKFTVESNIERWSNFLAMAQQQATTWRARAGLRCAMRAKGSLLERVLWRVPNNFRANRAR